MRILTRGLGKNPPGVQGFITMGFGQRLIEEVIRIVRKGQSGTKRALQQLQEVGVWVGLISVNDERPENKVQGFVKVRVNSAANQAVSAAQLVSSRIRNVFEDVKVKIKRVE
jgi:hypothetical protein